MENQNVTPSGEVNWDRYKDFEVLESVVVDKTPGSKVRFAFLSNEKLVTAEQILSAQKKKNTRSKIKPVDNWVFKVQVVGESGPKQFWLKTTQHTNIRELGAIRVANGNTLVGAKIEVERLQSGDPNQPSITLRKI